ncbi:aldolase/citrate lyase family protein [Ferrovibrio sp.]|uniref:HpcH/HpaI aldolase family protein n=1 Tax=Ferrovibrio sp. TaxID=1917215 RepID=UPI0025C42823|nr:aldolase/citrate lyase family protein [Ferrovibrio sp.]MBX3454181.1 2,4-dihydroxyhept-2-ene-1,7-dioic acid aldolase [Ferrovibrio sp.]
MRNTLKMRLQARSACVNGWLSIPAAYSAEVMARCAWHSITVDLQHGVQDYASMVHCFQAMSAFPVTPLVRVPSNEPGIIGKALDAGAWGVICPLVNTAEEAKALANACLYPPVGRRSNGPNRASSYGGDKLYQDIANDEVLVLPMIETAEAVSNLEAILDVPGVSGVYVGPSDLGFAMGLRPIFDREEPMILDIYATVTKEASRRGKFAGIHTINPLYANRMIDMGFNFVTVGSDASLMMKAAKEALAALHLRD